MSNPKNFFLNIRKIIDLFEECSAAYFQWICSGAVVVVVDTFTTWQLPPNDLQSWAPLGVEEYVGFEPASFHDELETCAM